MTKSLMTNVFENPQKKFNFWPKNVGHLMGCGLISTIDLVN
jgi:hypothetical protein